jgi:hypothetical protein
LCGAPARAESTHQKLLHFLARSEWEDRPVRVLAARYGLKEMQRRHAITHWIIDDTGFLKQGKCSPGVKRQYTGSAGKVTNCQVAVSLTLSNEQTQLPIDFALFVPEEWAADRERCAAAKIPTAIGYKPKWQLAVDMIDAAIAADLPRGVVLADADYGNKSAFRDALDERGLQYAVAVQLTTRVRRVHHSGARRRLGAPMSVEELAFSLSEKSIRKTTWREGTGAPMRLRGWKGVPGWEGFRGRCGCRARVCFTRWNARARARGVTERRGEEASAAPVMIAVGVRTKRMRPVGACVGANGRSWPRVRREAAPLEVQRENKASWAGADGRGGGLAPWSSRAISSASVIAATMRIVPPHRRQVVTSMANTLAKSLAQPMRALLGPGPVVPGCDAEACQGRRWVGSNNGTCVGTTQGVQQGATRMRARRA